MVVGVHKSLEEGRTYSYAELRDRFGLAGPDLEPECSIVSWSAGG